MHRTLGGTAALVLTLLVTGCASVPSGQGDPFDLSLLDEGTVALRGEWDWYPGVFLDPSAPRPPAPQRILQPGPVPAGVRYGTLAVAIRAGAHPRGLRLPTPGSAAAFYWNGALIALIGTPGASVETHRAAPGHRFVTITGDSDLVVHLSSFELASPGFSEPVMAGSVHAIETFRLVQLGTSVLVLSFLVFFALYHMLLYFFWPRDRAPLFLGLCSLLLGVRSVYTGALPILLVWPDLSYEGALRVIYVALFGAVAAWFAYLRVLFPHALRRSSWPLLIGGVLAFDGLMVVLPLQALLLTTPLALGLAFVAAGVSLWLVVLEAVKGDGTATFVAVGAGILACFSLHDLLNEARVLNTGFFLPVGMAFFLILQAVSIVRRFSLAFQSVETLSGELRQSFLEAQRRLRITKVYTRHSLVEIIEKGGDPTAFLPEARKTAVVFCDVRDFTKLTERLDPRQTVRFLNAYFSAMNSCVDRERGEVDKLIGDGIMALFDDPDAALRSALSMRRSLKELNTNPVLDLVLDNGIGINYGEVVLGNLGSPSKLDYTVIGDIVNSANRLESLTRYYGTPILVAEDLTRVLNNPYHLRFVDQILMKGKSLPTKIFEVYDHLEDEEIAFRKASAVSEAEAFRFYELGDFTRAQEIYGSLLRLRGPGPGPGAASPDPVLDVWFNRCTVLETRRQRGVLESWNGVWDFTTK